MGIRSPGQFDGFALATDSPWHRRERRSALRSRHQPVREAKSAIAFSLHAADRVGNARLVALNISEPVQYWYWCETMVRAECRLAERVRTSDMRQQHYRLAKRLAGNLERESAPSVLLTLDKLSSASGVYEAEFFWDT
jgi:hypothetical protein